MYKLLVAVAAVLVAAPEVCEAVCSFAGEDRPVQVDFSEVAKKRYNEMYTTESPIAKRVDHVYKDYSKVGDYAYRCLTTAVIDFGLKIEVNSTVWYTDGLLHEILDFKDDSGNDVKLTWYIVAKTDEGALLVHRCDGKDSQKLMRKILVPFGITLSEESLKQLMDADKKFSNLPNYQTLYKLPNIL